IPPPQPYKNDRALRSVIFVYLRDSNPRRLRQQARRRVRWNEAARRSLVRGLPIGKGRSPLSLLPSHTRAPLIINGSSPRMSYNKINKERLMADMTKKSFDK